MAHSSDNEGAGSKARHVLSEQAFALYGEPILDLSESGTLSGLNQVADAFLKSISNDVRQQIIDIAQPALCQAPGRAAEPRGRYRGRIRGRHRDRQRD